MSENEASFLKKVSLLFFSARKSGRFSSHRELRSFWRVLIAGFVFLPITQMLAVFTVQSLPIGVPQSQKIVLEGSIMAVIITAILFVWVRYVEYDYFTELGFAVSSSWLGELLLGLWSVTAVYFVWINLIIFYGGRFQIIGVTTSSSLVVSSLLLGSGFVGTVLVAYVQDTVFFGVVLRNAVEGFHSWGASVFASKLLAVLITSIPFVLVRGLPSSVFPTVELLLSGLVLGLLYVHSFGRLALPIGVHTGIQFVNTYLTVQLPRELSQLQYVPKILFVYVLIIGILYVHYDEIGLVLKNEG